MVDFRELVRLGAHFGHIKRRLHPKMNRYIWGVKNNVHLIDVSKTARLTESAAKFLESVARNGKTILWIGTKKAAQNAIFEAADKLKMPYVNHRWIGGTLSNFSQVKKSVTKLLHYEDILAKSEKFPFYTKKELNSFTKMVERLKKNIGGIRGLSWPIGAIVLVDVMKEGSALREAATVGIPVVALVDTNSDPSLVDHVIPINDDSARVVRYVIEFLEQAALKGQKEAKDQEKRQKEEAAAAKKSKLKAEGAAGDGAKKKIIEKKHVAKRPVATKKTAAPAAKRPEPVKKEAAPKKPATKPKAEEAGVKEAKPKKAPAAKASDSVKTSPRQARDIAQDKLKPASKAANKQESESKKKKSADTDKKKEATAQKK